MFIFFIYFPSRKKRRGRSERNSCPLSEHDVSTQFLKKIINIMYLLYFFDIIYFYLDCEFKGLSEHEIFYVCAWMTVELRPPMIFTYLDICIFIRILDLLRTTS